ncbi:MAG: hypothetical protein ACIAQZ_00945 [Sedimentisphaeraceae bacterium JB056]
MKKLIFSLVLSLFMLTFVSAESMPVYKRDSSNEGPWEWMTENSYRVVIQCKKYPVDNAVHRIAWTRLDFDYAYGSELIESDVDLDTIRVIAYDKTTMEPVRYLGGNSESILAYLVPAKVDQWGRRGDSISVLRDTQLSWIRMDNDSNIVYICYFDVHGSGESIPVAKPSYIGTGDALSFGTTESTEYFRGSPIVYDRDGDGDKDIITYCGSTPEIAVYTVYNDGTDLTATLPKPVEVGGHLGNGYKQIDDIDNDGTLDLVIVGRYYPDIQNNDLTQYVDIAYPVGSTVVDELLPECRTVFWQLSDWDGDGVRDLMLSCGWWGDYGWDDAYDSSGNWTNGPLRGWFYFFKNNGDNVTFDLAQPVKLTHADSSDIEVYGRPTPVFEDFNNDGLLDLMTSEFTGDIYVYINIGTSGLPQLGDKQRLATVSGDFESDFEALTLHTVDWDDDGDLDIFFQGENKRVGYMENTGTFTVGDVPIYEDVVYLTIESDFPNAAALAVGDLYDWDSDGDLDLIFGDSAGYLGWYQATGSYPDMTYVSREMFTNGGEPIRIVAGENGSIQGPAEELWGYTVPCAGDWNNDGYPDIMLNSILGQVVWYANPGTAGAVELGSQSSVIVNWTSTPPKPAWQWWDPQSGEWCTQWRSTVQMLDYNFDGLLDVAALDYEGYLVLHVRSDNGTSLELSPGQRIFLDADSQPWQMNSLDGGASGRRKFELTDWDNDGDWDVIVDDSDHGANVSLYENITDNNSPKFVLRDALADMILVGHTCAPTVFDLENDGNKDLIISAEDGHFYCFHRDYIENRMALQASFVGDDKAVAADNNIILMEDSLNGEIYGATRTRGATYSGQWLYDIENNDYQILEVEMDLAENINIKENTILKAAFNFIPDAQHTVTELARIDVTAVCDGVEQIISYLPANSEYTISGLLQSGSLVFDDDPYTWQQITLDLTSGSGLPAVNMLEDTSIINNITFVFDQPLIAELDYVRVSPDPALYVTTCDFELVGDLNKDCIVDMKDMAAMAANWMVE